MRGQIKQNPIVIVNFKNVKKGKEVLKFAKEINNPCLVVAVPTVNLKEIARGTDLITMAQYINEMTLEELKSFGVQGTLLNHSDYLIPLKKIGELTRKCNKLKLKVVICTKNINQVGKLMKFKSWAIAYEDPKLIGTKNPVTDHPMDVLKFVSHFKRSKIVPLCGAGINKKQDVENALKLGCKGVLISSAVMKSKNPKSFLKKINI